MKTIYSLIFLASMLLSATVLALAAEPSKPSMETPAAALEAVFSVALSDAYSGRYMKAYESLSLNRNFAQVVGTPVPEKYDALLKLTGEETARILIRGMRVLYARGGQQEMEGASKLCDRAIDIFRKEGLLIPNVLERIRDKLDRGMQELFFIDYVTDEEPVGT